MRDKRNRFLKAGTIVYFLLLVFIVVFIILPAIFDRGGGWIDLSGFFIFGGIILSIILTMIYGVYYYLVNSYFNGTFKKASMIVVSLLVLIIGSVYGAELYKDYKREQQMKDFSQATELKINQKFEQRGNTEAIYYSKYILHIPNEGNLYIDGYGDIKDVDVLNQEKEYIVKDHKVPVLIRNVKPGEVYYIIGWRKSHYVDSYTIIPTLK